VAGRARKVGAAEEGHQGIRVEKSGQGPAATLLIEELMGKLVNPVQVRTFLPVYLDVDEVGVHDCRRIRILERLVGHDMAPVAGGVAHRQQDRPARFPGQGDGLVVPGLPCHRVAGMLQQIGAGGGGEAILGDIGHGGSGRGPRWYFPGD
jgi:hypothetical protein